MTFEARRLGERLLIYRRRKRWSQRDLAAEAGVNHITIARLERGRMPHVSVDVVYRLADALGVSLDHLTGRAIDPDLEPAEVEKVPA